MVVSAFAAEKSDAKQSTKGDKKNVKRGIFGLGYGGGGYLGGYGGYGGLGGLGYYGGGHGYSSYAAAPLAYSAPAAHYSSHYVQPHTHTHSVETKVVAQVRIDLILIFNIIYNTLEFNSIFFLYPAISSC